jgi:chromosomal replication initiation ATPase DnaA
MLVERLPVVQHVLENARNEIEQLTGIHVRLTVEQLPKDKTDKMLQLIADLVCAEFAVSWEQLKGKKRYTGNDLIDARHTFMYIAHRVKGFSCIVTGKYVGNKNHSTVLHASRKIMGYIKMSDPVVGRIKKIIQQLP